MLSPHEFATLMLVTLEKLASGGERFSITGDGDSILQAVARIS